MKQKSVKYAFYGFIAGLGVTLVCFILIFLALGAVGAASPMLPVIAGIFMPAGAALGYKLGAADTKDAVYMPIAAYIAGAAAFVVLRVLYSSRSFYLGGIVFMLFLCTIFFYVLPAQKAAKLYEEARGKIIKKYLEFGLPVAMLAGFLTWNIPVFIVCAVITLAACLILYSRLKAEKPALRKKEVPPHSVLEITPLTERIPVQKKTKLFFIPAALAFLVFGTAGYFAYPFLNNIYAFSFSVALAALISLAFGRLLPQGGKKC
ncbi:MAG: hypothetical protein LBD73_03415 [Deferribacteraceae bacterium]|jgi:hypothetical protein|nr:hypothetical protein [Deferribacteraceae bacterium]